MKWILLRLTTYMLLGWMLTFNFCYGQENYFEKKYEQQYANDKLRKALNKELNVQSLVIKYKDDLSSEFINLNSKDLQVFKLPAIPSSGYTWEITSSDEKNIELITKEAEPGVGPGAEVHERFVFKGISKGQTKLTFVYRRPWEKNKLGLKKITVIVNSLGAYTGSFNYEKEMPVQVQLSKTKSTRSTLPSSWDWRDQNIMTPVKDQGASNGCWAFGSCGAFEAIIKRETGIERDLSEQWLCNCNPYGFTCSNGGWFPQQMFIDYGAVYESEEPFIAKDGSCKSSYSYGEKAIGWGYVDGVADTPSPKLNHSATNEQLKQACYTYGPIAINLYVGSGWNNYNGGVYNTNDGGSGHIVTLVGWDDSNSCWIIKNTWGTSWGENGYIRIAYNLSKIDVGGYSVWLEYKNDPTAPPNATFSADKTIINSGSNVKFTSTTGNNPTSWAWTFEGGTPSSSNQENPTVTYNTAGLYTASLVATNANGNDTETRTKYIFVDDYCLTSVISDMGVDYIKSVSVGTIRKDSKQEGYANFTHLVTELEQGSSNIISVKMNKAFADDRVFAWVDWNNNRNFDSSELINLSTPTSGTNVVVTGSVVVPSGTALGQYRMRVRSVYQSGGGTAQACGLNYSETEDYTVQIVSSGSNYCLATGKEASGEDHFTNVKIGSINHSSGQEAYSNFTAQSTDVEVGNNYPLTISMLNHYGQDKLYAWVDWNDNKTFDASELTNLNAPNVNHVSSTSITVPNGTSLGAKRMRLRVIWDNATTGAQACGDYYGEVEDYTLNVVSSIGNDTEKPSAPTGLLTSNITANSLTLSWNASSNNVAVTEYRVFKNDILETTVNSISATIEGLSSSTSYTFTVKALDANNNLSLASTPTIATTLDGSTSIPYCDGIHTGPLNYFYIKNVTLGSIDNSSTLGNSSTAYSDYTSLSTTLAKGSSHNLSVDWTPSWDANACKVYIDWDQDGEFNETDERVMSVSGGSVPYTGSINVPSTALSGSTRMRVRLTYSSNIDACSSLYNGETEDYTISVGAGASRDISLLDDFGVIVYPNPVSSQLSVNLTGVDQAKIQLISLDGRIVLHENTLSNSAVVNVSHLPSGMYFVKISSDEKIVIKKIIVN